MKKDERIRFIIIAVGIALIYGWIKPFSLSFSKVSSISFFILSFIFVSFRWLVFKSANRDLHYDNEQK